MQTKCGDGSVMVCGIVGKDAECRRVGDKQSVLTKFSIKAGDRVVDGQKQAIWVNCTAWNDMGKASSSLKKGDVALAVGRIQKSSYTGNDGLNHEKTELICEFVTAVLKDCLPNVGEQQNNSTYNLTDYSNDEDLPF